MLVLAVRTDAERVYRRALAYFTPDEIAEAFAAARGVASPTQLRTVDEAGRARPGRPVPGAGARRAGRSRCSAGGRAAWSTALASSPSVSLVAENVYEMFTPAELPIADEPTCGTGDLMIADGPGGADGDRRAVHRRAARRLGVGGVQRAPAAKRRFWLDSDQAGDHAVDVTLRPPTTCAVGGATEVPSDEVGMRRFERPEQLPPALRARPARTSPTARCVTYRLRVRRRRSARRRSFALDAALAFQPRASSSPRSPTARGLILCGAGAPPCPGGDGIDRASAGSAPACGAHRRRHRPGRRHHDRLAAAARHAARLGRGAARRRARLGHRRRWWRSASAAGTGAPTVSRCTWSPSASRRRWRPRSRSTCSPGPARWRIGERAGSSSRPARSAPCRRRIVVLPPLPRARAPRPAGGLRAVRSRPGRAGARRQPGGAPAACARGGGRRLRQARPDRRHARRPAAARRLRRAGRAAEPRRRPSRARRSPPCSRPSSATTSTRSSPSSTGSRSPRHRSARPIAPACAPARPSSSRSSARASRRRWSATWPRSRCSPTSPSGARRSGSGVRSGDMLAQFAEGLRDELDFRREADAMTEMAAPPRRRRTVRVPTAASPPVHPADPRAGALRGLHGAPTPPRPRRRRAVDRRALADQLLRSTLDQVLRLGFFHADPHPGNVFVLADGTLGLIDFGAVGRLDPIQQSAIVDMFAGLARRDVEPAARRRRAGGRRRRVGVAGRAGAGAGPDDGRARAARRHDRPDGDAGARRRAGATSGCACRPTSCCSRGRSSRSTARCACCRPASR